MWRRASSALASASAKSGGSDVNRARATIKPKRPKKVARAKKNAPPDNEYAHRVSAHALASNHAPNQLATALAHKFGARAVLRLREDSDEWTSLDEYSSALTDGALLQDGVIPEVICLRVPAQGDASTPETPMSHVFFFTGKGSSEREAGATARASRAAASAGALGDASPACVGVFWGASAQFESQLLRELRGQTMSISRKDAARRLGLPPEETRFRYGPRTELLGGSDDDEITLDGQALLLVRLLDQLALSAALQRHVRLQLVEESTDDLVVAMKRTVRQPRTLGAELLTSLLPRALGGSEASVPTMQRLLLLREFNFDSDVMSTPDWLWEQPGREALYDAMVAEYELEERIEAVNQQLDYAQSTLQSLKGDTEHRHSLFMEAVIVLLIAFEIIVEMHALEWINLPFSRGGERAADVTAVFTDVASGPAV